jgi:hypothetical protein
MNKSKAKSNEKNIIDIIELKLKELEREKDEIEILYGIDENILDEFTKKSELSESIKSSGKAVKRNFQQLPKLEVSKKEKVSNYKTPETLTDSLKYEPNIRDLYTEEEFEPTFKNLNQLKSYPSITQCYDISDYVMYQNKQYSKSFIN